MKGTIGVTSGCRENTPTGLVPARVSRSRALHRSGVALVTVALSTAVFAFPGTTTPAVAAPAALTIAEAKAQIEQLEVEAAAIDQDYVGVKEQIDQGRARLAAKKADSEAQSAKVERMKLQVGQVALARFQNRDVDTAAKIFFTSDDSDNFLSQVSTLEKVSQNQNNVLQDYQEQEAQLAEREHSNQTDLAVLTAQQKQLDKLRADSDQKVAESKKVLARLTEAERAALAAAEKAAEAAAKEQAEKALEDTAAASGPNRSRKTAPPAGRSKSEPDTRDAPAASSSGRGATALAFARSQLGKPYRFAAAGPAAYDCSGLTSAAWAAAGVRITRTARSQVHDGRAVAKSDLRAGDLVFYYDAGAPSHVAMYVGNGMIIHAPHSGAVVRYAPLASMPYVGARRPG